MKYLYLDESGELGTKDGSSGARAMLVCEDGGRHHGAPVGRGCQIEGCDSRYDGASGTMTDMGLGWRVFVIEDGGTMRRLSHDLYEKLRRGDATLPEYAGQELPIATVMLNVVKRKPTHILHVEGTKYIFDESGSIRESVSEGLSKIQRCLSEIDRNESTTGLRVVSLDLRRTRKREELRRWKPDTGEINRMIKAIWKS